MNATTKRPVTRVDACDCKCSFLDLQRDHNAPGFHNYITTANGYEVITKYSPLRKRAWTDVVPAWKVGPCKFCKTGRNRYRIVDVLRTIYHEPFADVRRAGLGEAHEAIVTRVLAGELP